MLWANFPSATSRRASCLSAFKNLSESIGIWQKLVFVPSRPSSNASWQSARVCSIALVSAERSPATTASIWFVIHLIACSFGVCRQP